MKKKLQIFARTVAEYVAFVAAGAAVLTTRVYFFPSAPSSVERSLEVRFLDLVLAPVRGHLDVFTLTPLPLPAEPVSVWVNALGFILAAGFFLAAKPWELISAFRRKGGDSK